MEALFGFDEDDDDDDQDGMLICFGIFMLACVQDRNEFVMGGI